MSTEESDIESDVQSNSDGESSSASDNESEKAVQLIKLERTPDIDEQLKLTLNTNQLSKILDSCGDRRLCIISVVGAVRSGKSFLLNIIKDKLTALQDGLPTGKNPTYQGFPFKPGYSPVTKGIWMWSKPFILDGDDEEIAVLLMDTEGVHDFYSKSDEIAAIVGISLLASSLLILNFSGDLSRPPFDWLSPYIKKGSKSCQFQKLSMLVRDWTKITLNRYGDKSGKKLADKFISQTTSRCGMINSAFEEIDCFLLPHIGEKALQDRFSGQTSDLGKEFIKHIQKYVGDLLDPSKLPVKKILETEITAQELKHFFVEYVSYFNNLEEMELGPKPEKISAITRQTAGSLKISRGLAEYNKTLKSRRSHTFGNFLRDQEIDSLHNQARKKALEQFKTFELPDAVEREFEQQFEQELNKIMTTTKSENKEARKNKINENITRAFTRLEEQLKTNFPFSFPAGTTIPSNLIFYEAGDLEHLIETTRQLVEAEFFEEFSDEDEDELADLRSLLDAKLNPICEEYRDKNGQNRERANEQAESTVDKFVSDYLTAMQKKIKRLPKIDEPTLVLFHETEVEKVESKFGNMKLGTPEFQQEWRDDMVEKIEEEFETLRLGLEHTMAEAVKLITETTAQYQLELTEKANEMEEGEILSFHQDQAAAIMLRFATMNPYPKENPKYDDVESRLRRKLQETYEKVVEDGVLARRNEEEKLEKAAESGCNVLKVTLEKYREDSGFLYEDECASAFDSSVESALDHFTKAVEKVKVDRQNKEEAKAKFLEKTQEYIDTWQKENTARRKSATEKADAVLARCSEMYEARMNANLKLLRDQDELFKEHESAKDAAVKMFEKDCHLKHGMLVAQSIQKLEQRMDDISDEIAEHFELIQQSYEVGLRAALLDAKSYYQESMDKRFESNGQGFFKEEELAQMNLDTLKGAKASVSKEHKLNKEQQKQLDKQLNNLYQKYRERNAMIKQSYNDKEVAIGIDLGTTYCCVAAYHMGKLEIVRNSSGHNITPSYVTINADGTTVVGQTAKTNAYQNPEATIFDAKRMIGRRLDDEKLKEDIKFWPFTVEEVDGSAKIKVHGKHYLPEQISAMVLKHLKKETEEILGVKVKKAVITVPAYFTDGQRQATIDAGELAGLEVLGILNEPTAAAVAYRLEWQGMGKARNILVYDLGGGTFEN